MRLEKSFRGGGGTRRITHTLSGAALPDITQTRQDISLKCERVLVIFL